MAKKIVNIVYRVDNSELEATKVKLQQVEKETKASTDAMNKYSATATSGGRVASNTIAGMTLQMQQLKAQIDLTNQADTKRLNALKTQYNEVKAKVDQFNQSLANTSKETQSLSSSFQSFRNVATAVFSSVLIRGAISTELEMAKLQGRIEGVERAFKRAFVNAPAILNDVRKSTHGTVTDFELMQRTLQATNLGVSVEHLGVLFEFAAARAQQTGESVDYLVDSVVRGIGRKSILVLDNLGLSATRLRAQFGGAAIASKSVAEVTAGVAEIAKVELAKMGGYVETNETRVKQLEVAWHKLKETIAESTASAAVVTYFQLVTEGFTRMIEGSEHANKALVEANVGLILSSIKTKEELLKEIGARQALYDASQTRIIDIRTEVKALPALDHATQEHRDALLEEGNALVKSNKIRADTIELLKQYLDTIGTGAKPVVTQAGLIDVLTDQIDNLGDALKKATTEDAIGKINTQIEDLQHRLKQLKERRAEDSDPFVLISPIDNKTALDVVTDNYEKGLGELSDMLADYNKEIKKKLDETHDAEQRDEQAHATQMLAIAENLSEERKRIAKEEENYKKQLRAAEIQYGLQALDRILTATFINRDNDIQDLQEYYQKGIDAAGNNDKAKKRLERQRDVEIEKARVKQVQQDRDDALAKIAIDTAIGVIRAIATPPVPNFALGAIMLGAGLVEAATVKSVSGKSLRTRAFKDGEVDINGPGTTTSDSILSRISKHESVINAEATLASKNLLTAINERKIDDRVMGKLVGNGGARSVNVFDDTRLIKAVQANKTDLIKQGYTLYETKTDGENFRRVIRSKIQGY